MGYEENEKLLDDKGQWVSRGDDMAHLDKKIVIGFLQDSHHNVMGFASKGISSEISISGYACSHFRLLSADEIEKYCLHGQMKLKEEVNNLSLQDYYYIYDTGESFYEYIKIIASSQKEADLLLWDEENYVNIDGLFIDSFSSEEEDVYGISNLSCLHTLVSVPSVYIDNIEIFLLANSDRMYSLLDLKKEVFNNNELSKKIETLDNLSYCIDEKSLKDAKITIKTHEVESKIKKTYASENDIEQLKNN